jgi:ferredoxin
MLFARVIGVVFWVLISAQIARSAERFPPPNFEFWREGCVCSIGSIQNITLALFDASYIVPLPVIVFFVLPILFTLFFGRTFCAGVCPLGAIQDVVSVHPVRVPHWLEAGLGMIPYFYLGGAVLFAATGSRFIICEYDPFVAFFRRSGSLEMFILGGSFLLIGLVVERPYCRFFCPYGALLNWVSRVAKSHVNITPSECIQCHLCADACPTGVIRLPTADTFGGRPAHIRRRDRSRLLVCLVLLPLFIGLSGWFGGHLGPALSRSNATVLLAERIWLEDTGQVVERSDASAVFRATGRPLEELHAEVLNLRQQFILGGGLFGAFAGGVMGMKLVLLAIRRRSVDYEINRGGCVSCGRCFDSCPVGKEPADVDLLVIEGIAV